MVLMVLAGIVVQTDCVIVVMVDKQRLIADL